MTPNDIISEISYAYLHAVASAARASCISATRIEDNNGIDANLTIFGPFAADPDRHEVDVKIQLKATTQDLTESELHYSYPFSGVDQYNKLRSVGSNPFKILVLLQLPRVQDDWLHITADQLIMKRCARWVSLRGAQGTTNQSSVTVYVPKIQIFSPQALREISELIAADTPPLYAGCQNG